jgi:hypothetical protein
VKKCKNASGNELTLLGGLSTANNNPRTNLYYDVSTDVLVFDSYNTSFDIQLKTNAVFRDNSAWAHVVLTVDTTQATSTNRVKLYVNNVEQTFGTTTYPSPSFDTHINAAAAQFIGSFRANTGFFDGYLAEVHFIDGAALTPSSFTETDATTGQLIPKTYTGSYGTNGYKLTFSDNSNNTAATLGADTSGNGNNWTPNNLSVIAGAGNDSLVDTPTNSGTDTGVGGEVRGNYCTLNPLNNNAGSLENGNLLSNSTTAHRGVSGTIAMPAGGKYYFEGTSASWTSPPFFGVADPKYALYAGTTTGPNGVGVAAAFQGYRADGQLYDGNIGATAYGASWGIGDIIGVAYDGTTGQLTFYKNGVSQGVAATLSTSVNWLPVVTTYDGNCTVNFGQRPFAYTAPSGFKALCTQNLPDPVVAQPSTVFDVKLWTGTGATQSITNVGFNPDFLWIKSRSPGYNHHIYDSVRGIDKFLRTNQTQSEFTVSPLDQITSLNANGFTLGADSSSPGNFEVNQLNTTYVGWLWDAGGEPTTNNVAGAGNVPTAGSAKVNGANMTTALAGSIAATRLSVNTSAGFSIVTFNMGPANTYTVDHGLNVAPEFIITKSRGPNAFNWYVYHKTLGTSQVISLNSANPASASSNVWSSTAPSSTVFGIVSGQTQPANDNIVAYCFAPVAGYSNAFTYSGNGSSDGPMVSLGFRPKLLLIKRSDSSAEWKLLDTVRSSGGNVVDDILYPDGTYTEGSNDANHAYDFLSNGFKVRTTHPTSNASGGTYIGFAWAESPFKYARTR